MFEVQVLTTSRADFGIYRSVLSALADHPDLSPRLLVTGTHIKDLHVVRSSGYDIVAEFECLQDAQDNPRTVTDAMGRALAQAGAVFANHAPDIFLTLGDRFEMCAAAQAAIPYRIPVAHIHGGEETEGAIDNVFRHMLTKLAQLHFPATQTSAARILQMGEAPSRVVVAGAPAIDSIRTTPRLSDTDMLARFGLDMAQPFDLVTFHPETHAPERSLQDLQNLLSLLAFAEPRTVITGVNVDTGHRNVREVLAQFAQSHPDTLIVDSFGAQAYYTAMERAQIMLGNSSSGILEAASVGLPVVNIGRRQAGRERSKNTVDTTGELAVLKVAIAKARGLRGQRFTNVYGQGAAGQTIAKAIAAALPLGVEKKFYNID